MRSERVGSTARGAPGRGMDPGWIPAAALAALLLWPAAPAWSRAEPPGAAQAPAPAGAPVIAQNEAPPAGAGPTEGTQAVPSLTVESVPTGAMVTLNGAYQWVGQTPWRLYREVSGVYEVEARLPGYETWRGQTVLGPGGAQRLLIELSRKTVVKAAARSVLVPGWGQFYQGANTKGTIFLAGGLAGLAGVIWTHEVYQHRLDDFNAAKRSYEDAGHEADLPALRAKVQRASDRADRAYDDRKLALGILAGVYAVNLVDAVFFTSSSVLGVTGAASASALPEHRETARLEWSAGIAADARVSTGLTYRWR